MQGGFFIKDILGLKQKKSREEEGRGGTPLTFRPTRRPVSILDI